MENSYGFGVTNRYQIFLDDESDPLETIKIKELEKEQKKKNKVAEKENKGKPEAPNKGKTAQTVKKTTKDAPTKVQDSKREDSKPTNQRSAEKNDRTKFNNENREERNNRRNREDRPLNGGNFENNRDRDREDRPRRDQTDSFESRRGRTAGNNKPMNRGGIGGAGGSGGDRPRRQFDDRRGKREFDRQSGSDITHGYRGVKPIDKRDGGGAHNWGSHKDVIEYYREADNNKSTDNEQLWNENEKVEAPVINTEPKENETEIESTPVEEEPKELTLDEWKAQRAGRQKPTYNLRKAGEGEDPTQWKQMYELNKKKEEGEEESDDDEYDVSEYPQRVGRQKRVVGIDFQFYDSKRGGPGRGHGARTGRGGRSNRDARTDKPGPNNRFRDEPRDDRNDICNAPKVDDERDFPSLG